jgi:hypothetical protein
VDHEKECVISKSVPKRLGPFILAKESMIIFGADEVRSSRALVTQREPEGIDERIDHEGRINQHRRGQENRDMKGAAFVWGGFQELQEFRSCRIGQRYSGLRGGIRSIRLEVRSSEACILQLLNS